MSALATEMIHWAEDGEYEEVKKFLDEIEKSGALVTFLKYELAGPHEVLR